MSIFSKIGKAVKKIIPAAAPILGGMIGGPAGAILGGLATGKSPMMPAAASAILPAAAAGARVLPGLGRALTGGAVGGMVVAGGRVVARSAKSIYNSAASYCRRHPQWCATVGGIAAVEALVSNGQLPVIKRRRRKGITARELGSFTRVARIFKKYCGVASKARTPRKRC